MINEADSAGKTGTTVMVLRMLPERTERLFQDADSALMFNAAAFRELPQGELRRAVRQSFAEAERIASSADTRFAPNGDFRTFVDDMLRLLPKPEFGDRAIRPLLFVIAEYRKCWKGAHGDEIWPEGPQHPEYDISRHPALVRFGNVELRVVEDFLLAPDDLRTAMQTVLKKYMSEEEMYAPAQGSGEFVHDDPDYNLRRLMTNAGFYVGRDPDRASETLGEWAGKYIAALRNSHLSWSNKKALFFLRIQRALHEKTGFIPSYVGMPSNRQMYDNMAGKEVLFVSPLAHIVNEQITSGNVWKLYQDYEVPPFSARAIPAWISTWPNRPHGDWGETFQRLCDSVHTAYREKPFDVFIAACGCYGLPISEFARAQYGCSTLYVGHLSHKLFGIVSPQTAESINAEMWVQSDLGKYPNVDRIDKGRYVNPTRRKRLRET